MTPISRALRVVAGPAGGGTEAAIQEQFERGRWFCGGPLGVAARPDPWCRGAAHAEADAPERDRRRPREAVGADAEGLRAIRRADGA